MRPKHLKGLPSTDFVLRNPSHYRWSGIGFFSLGNGGSPNKYHLLDRE
jgi:hypothetical protein